MDMRTIPELRMPAVDVKALLEEDAKNNDVSKPFRFGKAIENEIHYNSTVKVIKKVSFKRKKYENNEIFLINTDNSLLVMSERTYDSAGR